MRQQVVQHHNIKYFSFKKAKHHVWLFLYLNLLQPIVYMEIIVSYNRKKIVSAFHKLIRKELCVAIYFIFFISGVVNFSSGYHFYNEYRILEVAILLLLGLWAVLKGKYKVNKNEVFFFFLIAVGSIFWQQPLFIIVDSLLAYLLFKAFQFLNFNKLITKIIVLSSLVLFLMLPVALLDYASSGTYVANWYPLSWNIRVYDSYFLILSIFATWFYTREKRYKKIYLLFLFLAFFAVLLDAGRAVTLAYTAFIAIVTVYHKPTRLPLLGIYIASWLAYIAITCAASFSSDGLAIVRESSSGRIDLWNNGFKCWLQHPIFGCGFYQLEEYPHLSAHPHNLFIQIVTETGLIGFGFLLITFYKIAKNISWNLKENYFVIAALIAGGIDVSLSGAYIYPITQMALLWMFVFLLKNPAFAHAQYFNQPIKNDRTIVKYFSILILLILIIIFGYVISHTSIFLESMPSTPPRFWGYGYHLF